MARKRQKPQQEKQRQRHVAPVATESIALLSRAACPACPTPSTDALYAAGWRRQWGKVTEAPTMATAAAPVLALPMGVMLANAAEHVEPAAAEATEAVVEVMKGIERDGMLATRVKAAVPCRVLWADLSADDSDVESEVMDEAAVEVKKVVDGKDMQVVRAKSADPFKAPPLELMMATASVQGMQAIRAKAPEPIKASPWEPMLARAPEHAVELEKVREDKGAQAMKAEAVGPIRDPIVRAPQAKATEPANAAGLKAAKDAAEVKKVAVPVGLTAKKAAPGASQSSSASQVRGHLLGRACDRDNTGVTFAVTDDPLLQLTMRVMQAASACGQNEERHVKESIDEIAATSRNQACRMRRLENLLRWTQLYLHPD